MVNSGKIILYPKTFQSKKPSDLLSIVMSIGLLWKSKGNRSHFCEIYYDDGSGTIDLPQPALQGWQFALAEF